MYLLLIPISILLYKYRASILYGIAKGFVDLYLMIAKMLPEFENKITSVREIHRSDDFEIHNYTFVMANKIHDFNIITRDENHRLEYEDLLSVLEYKNAIVYCGLEMGDVTIDLTTDFRKFVYHFNKDDLLHYFFRYIKDVYKYEDENEKERDGIDFVVFFNDDELTQYSHKLRDVQNITFRELLKLD